MQKGKRLCGSCSACCHTHSVFGENLKILTRSFETCEHCITNTGCAIYSSRPSSCRTYKCMWLQGFGEDEHRPDKLGLVIDIFITETGQNILILWETEPKNMESPKAQQYLEKFLSVNKWTIIQMYSDGSSNVHFSSQISEEEKQQHLLIWDNLLKG